MTNELIELLHTMYLVIICHFIGDYVLQNDFLAKTKGENVYHLIIHCFLYTVPFYVCFGLDGRILWLLISHFITDIAKAKFKLINYVDDQITHYVVLLWYLI